MFNFLKIAALVLNVSQLSTNTYFYPTGDYVAAGIWGGIVYLTAGSLGIAATQKRTTSL